jgi:hypothetical protein
VQHNAAFLLISKYIKFLVLCHHLGIIVLASLLVLLGLALLCQMQACLLLNLLLLLKLQQIVEDALELKVIF